MECDDPATMLQHASGTAEAAEVSISIETVRATLRVFDAERCSISCTKFYFIPVSNSSSLTSELWSSAPPEAAHVGGGALHPSKYTLAYNP